MPKSTMDLVIPDDLKCFVYGDSGTGKTWLIGTAPKPVYILNFDPHGYRTLSGIPGVEYDDFYCEDIKKDSIRIKREVWNRMRELKTETKYATIAFDSLTFLSNMLLGAIVSLTGRWGKEPEVRQEDWGTLGDDTEEFIRMGLALPGHGIFTSHGKVQIHNLDKTGDQQEILYLPMQNGVKFPQQVAAFFDEFYKTIVKPKGPNQPNDYFLQTKSDYKWGAKSRLNMYDPEKKKPVPILDPLEQLDFSNIIEKIKKAKQRSA